MKKNIAILGSTGSIGKQTLEVVSAFPSFFSVVSIAAKNEIEEIISQIKTFKPLLVSVASDEVKSKVEAALSGQNVKIVTGEEGLLEVATHKAVNLVVAAIPGALSLKAVIGAVKLKKNIALATKEILVAAGDIFMEEVKSFPIDKYGPKIEHHPLFPKRINVEFVRVDNKEEITVRVWERGAAETLACGTGACASAVASHLNGHTGREVTVHLPGGDLQINWDERDNHVYMTGAAAEVYSGEVMLDSR